MAKFFSNKEVSTSILRCFLCCTYVDNERSDMLIKERQVLMFISCEILIKLNLMHFEQFVQPQTLQERRLTLHDMLMASPETPPRLHPLRPTSTPPKPDQNPRELQYQGVLLSKNFSVQYCQLPQKSESLHFGGQTEKETQSGTISHPSSGGHSFSKSIKRMKSQ